MAPRRQTKNRRQSRAKGMNTSANGMVLRVPSDPPQIVYRPFSRVVLSVTLKITATEGTFYMFHTDIIKYLAAQLGITVNNVRIRVVQAMLWNLTSKSIAGNFYEVVTGIDVNGNRSLVYLTDNANPMTYARVGYRWPLTVTNNVVANNDPQTTFYKIQGNVDDLILHRVTLFYANV